MPPDTTSSFRHLKRTFNIDTLFLEIPIMGICGNVYVINDKNAVIMIDTGPKTPSNIKTISRYIESRKKPVYLLLTHEHTDHIGLARVLQTQYGSTVFIHNKSKTWTTNFEAKWDQRCTLVHDLLISSGFPSKYVNYFDEFHKIKIYAESFDSNHYVNDNDILDLSGRKMQVIYTPGHSVGSACYYDYEYKLLFCGDHVVGGYNTLPTIDYVGNCNSRYSSINNSIKSFAKLEQYNSSSFALQGHGGIITDLGKYKTNYIGYIEKYMASILGHLEIYVELTPFDMYMLVYNHSRVKSVNQFFGRIQILFCILDFLESKSTIRRNKIQDAIYYSITKGI